MSTIEGVPFIGTGHIDDLTIYQRKGKVIARYRHNSTSGHPRHSENQLRQRTRWANNIRLWNSFPRGFRPYFQGQRSGTSCYNTFMSYALQAHPVYLTKQMAITGTCVLTDVMVSQGTLNEIRVVRDGSGPITDIRLGGLTIDDHTTVQQLAKAIVRNNFNYRLGDRLRYYLAEQRLFFDDDTPMVVIDCYELVLDTADSRLLHEAVGDCPGFAQRSGQLAARYEVTGGMAWVHLRHNANGTLASTQRMICHNDELMERYGSDEAFAAACESYRRN